MSEPVEVDERTHGLGPTRARVLALLQDGGRKRFRFVTPYTYISTLKLR